MTSLPFEKLLNQTHRPFQAGKTWPQTKLVAVGHCCKLTVDSSPNNQCKVIASLQPHLGHPVPHLLARLFHPLMVKSTISIAREGAFFLSPPSITARLPLRTTIDRSLSPVYLGSATAAFSRTRPRTLWNKRWILRCGGRKKRPVTLHLLAARLLARASGPGAARYFWIRGARATELSESLPSVRWTQ